MLVLGQPLSSLLLALFLFSPFPLPLVMRHSICGAVSFWVVTVFSAVQVAHSALHR